MNMRDTAWGDHPRMCGEHLGGVPMWMMSGGSSPHVRGARRLTLTPRPAAGIIPACAGSTEAGEFAGDGAGDHPRMCGEHRLVASKLVLSQGSSPHVRGALMRTRS